MWDDSTAENYNYYFFSFEVIENPPPELNQQVQFSLNWGFMYRKTGSITVPEDLIVDPLGETVTYSMHYNGGELLGFMEFSPTTRTFEITPQSFNTYMLILRGTDQGTNSVDLSVVIEIQSKS